MQETWLEEAESFADIKAKSTNIEESAGFDDGYLAGQSKFDTGAENQMKSGFQAGRALGLKAKYSMMKELMEHMAKLQDDDEPTERILELKARLSRDTEPQEQEPCQELDAATTLQDYLVTVAPREFQGADMFQTRALDFARQCAVESEEEEREFAMRFESMEPLQDAWRGLALAFRTAAWPKPRAENLRRILRVIESTRQGKKGASA